MFKDLNEDMNKSHNEDLENTHTVDLDTENNAWHKSRIYQWNKFLKESMNWNKTVNEKIKTFKQKLQR